MHHIHFYIIFSLQLSIYVSHYLLIYQTFIERERENYLRITAYFPISNGENEENEKKKIKDRNNAKIQETDPNEIQTFIRRKYESIDQLNLCQYIVISLEFGI